ALVKVGNSDFATAWGQINYSDIEGKVPKSALPDLGNATTPVESEAAMLNLPAVPGNQAIRTDIGKTFVLIELPANKLENWMEIVTTSDVQSVNGQTGNVTLTKSDVGLSNVNNTADADKPVATQSVNGLLSKADKAKLDKATSGATFNTLVERDMTGSFSATRIILSSNPAANSHATTKEYVDSTVSTVAGGSRLTTDNLDTLRSAAVTGVIEGFVRGCPAGGKVTGSASAGFVEGPVWKLEVRPEGLDYATQRIQLLNCTPKFMIGFAWERIYNPAAGKWAEWTCVSGDTGEIKSTASNGTALVENPFRHKNNSQAVLYNDTEPLIVRRTGLHINVMGAVKPNSSKSLDMLIQTSSTNGLPIAYFDHSQNSGMLGCEYLFIPSGYRSGFGRQQGSSRNSWYMDWLYGVDPANAFVACRYGDPANASMRSWLTFNVTYGAPVINTYTGPGFIPPVIPSQSDTGN